jgi:hypothetical protein
VADDDLYVVVVTDHLTPALVSHAGAHYISPPQDEDLVRLLIRVLIGSPQTPTGKGPWARPVAGGRRHIAMRRVAGE